MSSKKCIITLRQRHGGRYSPTARGVRRGQLRHWGREEEASEAPGAPSPALGASMEEAVCGSPFRTVSLLFPSHFQAGHLESPVLFPFIRSKGRKSLYSKMTSFFKSQLCNSFPSARLLPGHCWGSGGWQRPSVCQSLWQGVREPLQSLSSGWAGRQGLQPLLSCGDAVVGERQACSLPRRVAIREEGPPGREPGFPSQLLCTAFWFCGKAGILMASLAGDASRAHRSDKLMEAADREFLKSFNFCKLQKVCACICVWW